MAWKKILLFLLVAIIIFLIIGFYNASKLKTIEIEKKVKVNAPQQRVYEAIADLNQYPNWSPFLAQDPSQKYEVKGNAGEVGSSYSWTGNGGTDVGIQEITKTEPNNFVGMKCDIQKPFSAKPTFDYHISQQGAQTEVTQKFRLESGLMDAFFLWLFGVKKEMAATNEQGLQLLKDYLEK
ncbi:SRPBCC family protein [Cruoricaptor ignavus]|uniref:SRPBCC family protein n=1 Tax=Cruoricaptor ignavus TaxID=1118202 RepID=UPI00370D4D5A